MGFPVGKGTPKRIPQGESPLSHLGESGGRSVIRVVNLRPMPGLRSARFFCPSVRLI